MSYDQLRRARYAVYVVPYFIKIKYVFLSINNFVIYTHIIVRVVDIILITMINANMMDELKRNISRILFTMMYLL